MISNERRRASLDENIPRMTDVEWFGRTSHCGACGNPGGYCTCPPSRPCGCRGLHLMGSGLAPDALDAFAADVPDDHPELFGGTA